MISVCTTAARTHSPEAQEKRRETFRRRDELKRRLTLDYFQRGMVPLAIADDLGASDARIAGYLSEAGIEVPPYLSLHGPKRERKNCPHCGR